MIQDSNDIVTLIGKNLSGEISSEDKVILDAWIDQTHENKIYYEDITKLFNETAQLKTWHQFDEETAWTKFKSKLSSSIAQTKGEELYAMKMFWRVAASIVFIMGVGYFSYVKFLAVRDEFSITSNQATQQSTLPDGTEVFLNKNSTITYEYHPTKRKRKVKIEGEAYFKIADRQEEQLILETGNVIIEDIGTSFNVRAYPGSPFIEVYVATGEVAFYTLENEGIRLVEHETGIYDKKSNTFFKKEDTDENTLAYKTGVFVFQDAKMSSVVDAINEVYSVKLKLDDKAAENCRITVTFKNESIGVIADVIAETLSFNIEKSENEIILKGNECVK